MTEEQIKEQLSRHFVELLANRSGLKCYVSQPDHGCDLTIHGATPVSLPQGRQYVETGKLLQIQLKSACERVVERSHDVLRYDLSVRNYNALVHRRRQQNVATPYILVLFVLPDADIDWLTLSPDSLLLRKAAYWWYPERDAEISENARTQRIEIPTNNALHPDFASWAIDRFHP